MWHLPRFSCVAVLLPALLLLWFGAGPSGSGEADAAPAPTLGLLTLLGTSSNGSNIITDLLLNHVQAKINALEVIADLLAIAGTGSGGSSSDNSTDGA